MGEMRSAYKIFIGRHEGKKAFGRPSRICEDTIRMHLGVTEWEIVDCIHLVQDREYWWTVVNTVMNIRFP
jgi:hypothetical protein